MEGLNRGRRQSSLGPQVIQSSALIEALTKGFFDLLHPRMWFLIILPPLIAFSFWLVVFLYWTADWQAQFIGLLSGVPFLASWVGNEVWGLSVAKVLFWLVTLPLGFFAASATSLFILSLIGVPWIRRHLKNVYPQAIGGPSSASFIGSLGNVFRIFASAFFILILLVLLFWIPGVWGIGLFCLAVWMNTKLLFLEIATEIRLPAEPSLVWQQHSASLILLGVVFGLLFTIPFVNFIVPLWTALAMFHYLCGLHVKTPNDSSSYQNRR